MNLLLYLLLAGIVLALARRLTILLLGWPDSSLSLSSCALRIGLSTGLFLVLLLGALLGWWRPNPTLARHSGQ